MWINTANPVKCTHVYHGTYVRTRTCTCVPACCFYCIHNFFTNCICQFLLRASHPSACCSVTRLVRALTVRQPQQHQTTGTCTATGASPGCLLRSAPRDHARVGDESRSASSSRPDTARGTALACSSPLAHRWTWPCRGAAPWPLQLARPPRPSPRLSWLWSHGTGTEAERGVEGTPDHVFASEVLDGKQDARPQALRVVVVPADVVLKHRPAPFDGGQL